VKRLSKSSTQGVEELKNELALVAKLKHKNLVRLVGVCLEQHDRLLVYEFVSNRSLDKILFGTNMEYFSSLHFLFSFGILFSELIVA
jgi:serine/threonine protein kinase